MALVRLDTRDRNFEIRKTPAALAGLSLVIFISGLGFARVRVAQVPIRFRDVGPQVGLTTAPHFSTDPRYLVEMMGGGVALLDCDNDGRLDIVTVTDSTIQRYLRDGGDLMIRLYHQDGKNGELHFTDVTEAAGLTVRGWGMGVAVADFNDDGLPDIYVTGYGHNVLYRNLGGCKFQDVTEKAGLSVGGFSVGSAWADYDRDGFPDLFVARYVQSDIHHLPQPGDKSFDYKGLHVEVPEADGESDFLFRNRGDGTFEDVSQKAGVSNPTRQRGMGVVWADYDGDGWPDLFVANDVGPNFLYRNKANGTFEEVGMLTGTALGVGGRSMGNMAGDFADFDRDGRLDLVITRYGFQPVSLLRNEGASGFEDVTWASRIGQVSTSPVRWGTGFADFDNGGWPDVFIANGNVAPAVEKLPNENPYREPVQLFHNRGNGTFEEIANSAGLNNGPLQSRRGAAFGDIDNDGNVDAVVYNKGGPPSLFLNETKNPWHRVLFRLVGTESNRAAIGARVTVYTSKMTQMDEVRAGGSYLSSSDQRLHFGLGAETKMRRIEIRWPSGASEELKNVAADAIYTIVEGKGITKSVKLPPPGTKLQARGV
ncbi:MAG TPA: CRTAC1 family protein [Candidatus Acidoferrales bacterium]|nr:CRTAC1 family protein [Candidatus Acidoferrales bacterium]